MGECLGSLPLRGLSALGFLLLGQLAASWNAQGLREAQASARISSTQPGPKQTCNEYSLPDNKLLVSMLPLPSPHLGHSLRLPPKCEAFQLLVDIKEAVVASYVYFYSGLGTEVDKQFCGR